MLHAVSQLLATSTIGVLILLAGFGLPLSLGALPDLVLLAVLRPRIVIPIWLVTILGPFLVMTLIADQSWQNIAFAGAFVCVPLPVRWIVNVITWRRATGDQRISAGEYRMSLDRRSVPSKKTHVGRVWPTFIFDDARAKQQRAYEPPPV